jgi:chemotaxis protein MotB
MSRLLAWWVMPPRRCTTAINRRIDMLVLTKKAQRSIEGEQSEQAVPAAESSEDSNEAAPGQVPEEPLQPPQLRERLNIFEEGVLNFDEQK